jgi:adenosylcobinamide-phosphate synthase
MDEWGIGFMLAAAFALDLVLGDPAHWPHPVRWMGRAITGGEPWFRKLPLPPVICGGLFAAACVAGTWSLTWILRDAARQAHPLLGWGVETVLMYYCLAARALYDAAREIFGLLEGDQVDPAREKLSRIVGRDVARYGRRDIARAVVETVAENFVDGVLTPLLCAALGGAPLAMAFKMVSTLDSMVGYKNERYREFGKASARLDDAVNFLPARISVALVALAAQMLAGTGRRSLKTALAEGAHHTSPNAGWPEAAFAGALAVRLNGPNFYGGILVKKPFIGIRFGEVETGDIRKACDLMMLSSLFGLAAAMAVALLK